MATARISNVRDLTDGGAVAEAPEFAAKITVSPNIDERSGIKPRWNIRIENTSTNTTREFTDYAWDFEGAINLAVSSLSKNAAASSSSAAAKPPTSAPLRAGEVLDRALERQATGTRSQADASLIEKLRAEGYTEDQIQRALAALNNPTPPPAAGEAVRGLGSTAARDQTPPRATPQPEPASAENESIRQRQAEPRKVEQPDAANQRIAMPGYNPYSIGTLISVGLMAYSVYLMWPWIKDQLQTTNQKLISHCEDKVAFAANTTKIGSVSKTPYADTYLVQIDVQGYGRKGIIQCALVMHEGGWITTNETRLTPDTPLWISKY